MGQSTDAIIMFGFDLSDDLPECFRPPEVEDDEDEDSADPVEIFDNFCLSRAPVNLDREDYSEKSEFLDNFPYLLERHCSCNYPMYFVGLRRTRKLASRGYPKRLDQEFLSAPSVDEIEKFHDFCIQHGIPWPEEGPAWYVFSDWC